MTDPKRSAGLQTIFSFFLGLMVTAFVGVGTYTFLPPPHQAIDKQIEDISRKESAIHTTKPDTELTESDREQLQELNGRRDELQDASERAREAWGRTTSIVLVVLATMAMAVSLIRADQLPVLNNGLLMGGVFTMIYGVGWIVVTDTSVARFFVMTVALAVTLALGYIRFVRGHSAPTASAGSIVTDGLEDVERRLRDLEDRMNDAASALGRRGA